MPIAFAQLDRNDRVHVIRNALRFPFLGVMLLYAYAPLVGASGHRLGPIITTLPGPWGGLGAGLLCILSVVVYSALPSLRVELRPNRGLTDLHFFGAAVACMGLFAGLYGAGADAIYVKDPVLVERISSYIVLRAASGWLLLATMLLPGVQVLLLRRTGRSQPAADR